MNSHAPCSDPYLQRLFDELEATGPVVHAPQAPRALVYDEASEIADIRSISATYRAQGWLRPEMREAAMRFDPTAIPGGAEVLIPRDPPQLRGFMMLGAAAAVMVMGLSFALAAVLAQAS